jgi:hypothetical protein
MLFLVDYYVIVIKTSAYEHDICVDKLSLTTYVSIITLSYICSCLKHAILIEGESILREAVIQNFFMNVIRMVKLSDVIIIIQNMNQC